MRVRKAILPVAGLATRFLPATKSQPKTMLPIVDKPAIQYIVEEAVNSGITDIIIVTDHGKHSIEDHFDNSKILKAHLEKSGKHEEIKSLEEIEKLANIYYVRQDKPLGDGHAILCAKEFVRDEPFAVLFGDDIYDAETPALKQLIDQHETHNAPVIALLQVPQKEVYKYGVVAGTPHEDVHKIHELVEKPPVEEAPSDMIIVGRYIITPELLNTLENTPHGPDNELKLAYAMSDFIKDNPLYGYLIKGQRFDTGSKLGYLKAVVHHALKHPELKDDFKTHLQDIL